MVELCYTTLISVDLAQYEKFAISGKGGIIVSCCIVVLRPR